MAGDEAAAKNSFFLSSSPAPDPATGLTEAGGGAATAAAAGAGELVKAGAGETAVGAGDAAIGISSSERLEDECLN